jgi:uncharacterized protein
MNQSIVTLLLLTASNVFMTFAWYGHLKFAEWKILKDWGIWGIILISWGLAFFEYLLQVPANKFGFSGNGGPFNLVQLKMIQEVLNLSVFVIFTLVFFKSESFKVNHVYGAICLIFAIYFFFKS